MPQTKFVTGKALSLGLKPIVVVNKVDRPDERIQEVLDEVFDLFVTLEANDEQLDFPVLYASGRNGYANADPSLREGTLNPLFDRLRSQWETPDGWPISEPAIRNQHARELGLGFFYRWNPRPPDEWLDARRAYFAAEVSARRSTLPELEVLIFNSSSPLVT
jgi:hypothetical protein